MNPQPIRIMHLITGLNMGGAEMALANLVSRQAVSVFESRVVSMIPLGEVGLSLRAAGIPVESLEMPPGRATLKGVNQLLESLRQFRPQILQTWLYHADLLGLLAARLTSIPRLAWNVRSSTMDFSRYRPLSRLVVKVCALLSPLPDAVVVNSRVGQDNHLAYGYHPRHWEYIPNGVDIDLFSPNPDAGRGVRAEWQIGDDETLIGLVGRLDPQKDHPAFLKAAALALQSQPNLRLVCVGDGSATYRAQMQAIAAHLGLSSRMIWAGLRRDMPQVYNALDLLVLPSAYGEGFPNVVAEAMACGVPCIVTDIGDSALLVGETGQIVSPGNPQALANAILTMLGFSERERAQRRQQARNLIASQFSLATMVEKYTSFYQRIIES